MDILLMLDFVYKLDIINDNVSSECEKILTYIIFFLFFEIFFNKDS